MEYAVLSTEIFGIIVLMVVLYGAWFESKERSKKKKAFVFLTISVLISLGIDAVTYLPLNWKSMASAQFIVNLASLIVPFFVYAVFLQYIYIHMSTKASINKLPFIVGNAFCGVGIIATLYYGLGGYIFVINAGEYEIGEYYEGYLLTYVVIIVYTLIMIAHGIKKIGFHDVVAAVIFMAIPFGVLLINIFVIGFDFSISSLVISLLVINIMIQAERENKLMANVSASTKKAHSDELTGLLNRLAFIEDCDSMKGDGNIGVVFADLNYLKYTNDHYGHKAGDELLCKFANILLGCFRKDDVYRISGDEFVVLLPGMPLDTFERKTKYLKEIIDENDVPIAATGFVHGSQSEISRLVDMAEKAMYEEKKIFHEEHKSLSREH